MILTFSINQEEEEKLEEDMVKVEEKKNVTEGGRAEVKVPSAEPCESTDLSATTREEVQDEARATPPANHVRTHRSNKNASVTPVSAVSIVVTSDVCVYESKAISDYPNGHV